ncbi:MAG: hypothetical protein JWM94_2089 [Sphingomonas bacterium]|nr:hypothetical protein [Sphingomonas bacterium]
MGENAFFRNGGQRSAARHVYRLDFYFGFALGTDLAPEVRACSKCAPTVMPIILGSSMAGALGVGFGLGAEARFFTFCCAAATLDGVMEAAISAAMAARASKESRRMITSAAILSTIFTNATRAYSFLALCNMNLCWLSTNAERSGVWRSLTRCEGVLLLSSQPG